MTCKQLIDFIMSYRENQLPQEERSEFDRHLAVCPSCVNYMKTYERTVLLARACTEDPVPEDVPESLVQAILASQRKATR
jgi:anti-sigma factor RsiW